MPREDSVSLLKARVLVTDGEQRSALATVRSVATAGYTVFVASHKCSSLAGASRYAHREHLVSDPMRSPNEFAEDVRRIVTDHKIDVLLPMTEAALLALLPVRESIPAALPFPSFDAFSRLCDKGQVAAQARAIGIEVPRTIECRSREAWTLNAAEIRYPVVIKPHRSLALDADGRHKLTVRSVANPAELNATLHELPDSAYPVLVQEEITGDGVGVFVLLDRGEVRGSFAHRRIREKPPWGGVSVLRESVPMNRRLLDLSVELLRRFDMHGAAMVEYKLDNRSGKPYIMEINARFWGSLQLAIDSGVDFPALLVKTALGEAPVPVHEYTPGVRSRWFWGDVDNLIIQLRDAPESTVSPRDRVKAVVDFIKAFGPGNKSEVFRFADPGPALRETVDWLKALRRDRTQDVGRQEQTKVHTGVR
jgi:predicted ATP-grasp superfamily ATP-dependent carboligase